MTKLTFDEIQSKTLSWCKNLLDNDIYDINDYNKCIDSFNNDSSGEISEKMEVPRTGVEYNYGMYHRTKSYLEDSNIENTTSSIMITSNDGKYLGTKKDGKLYHVNNYQEPNVNQTELEWSIVPRSEGKISIMSNAYQTYLTSNVKNLVSASSTEMDSASIWKITKIENKILLESLISNNHYINYDKKESYCVKLIKDYKESSMWNFYPLDNNQDSLVEKVDEIEYKNKQMVLFNNYVMSKKVKKIIQNEILILNKLLILVSNVFDNVKLVLDNRFLQSKKEMNKKASNYLKEIAEIDEYRNRLSNTGLSSTLFDSYTNQMKELEEKIGLDKQTHMSYENKKKIDNELKIQKNKYIVLIQNEIKKRQKEYKNTKNLNNAEDTLDNFMKNLEAETDTLDNNLNDNNTIMKKQNSQVNTINNNNYSKKSKLNKIRENEEVVNINKELLEKKYNYKIKIRNYYYLGIFILFLIIVGVSYLTYQNLVEAYHK